MSAEIFTHTQEQLKEIAGDVLRFAQQKGASDAVVELSEGHGLSVSVRKGQVDTIEQNKDKGIGVTIFLGEGRAIRRGNASTSDFSLNSLKETVDAAYDIARFTAEDDCAGLPDDEMLERSPKDLDLFHPWAIQADQAVEIALRCDAAAFAVDKRIRKSEGAAVHAQQSHFVLANSRGFMGGYPYTRHSISVSPIAGKGQHMQRDDWYSSDRNPAKLASPEAVGRYAAERALARLNARKLDTGEVPVLFEAPVASGLLGAYVGAVSGGALYRKASFLVDSLGQQALAAHLDIDEEPHRPKGKGSAPFDDEGVRTRPRRAVDAGVVQGYFLSSYSARKLGMRTSGHAGGAHNLVLSSRLTQRGDDLPAMLRKLGRGLFVTELIGQGVNMVTGDYSRGAAGFWVEGGRIVHPVHEVTIAGNLRQMLRDIVAVGADAYDQGGRTTGSVLVARMKLAGA